MAAMDQIASVDLLLERARRAEEIEDFPLAERYWRLAIRRDHGLAESHTGLAAMLRDQGRAVEAEAVLLNALENLPPDQALFEGYAELADRRRDWTAAEQRWQTMRELFPHIWYCYTGAANAMLELGRSDEAVALLFDGAVRFPLEPTFPHKLGHLAASQSAWRTAETYWRTALAFERCPWWIYTEMARALEHQGRLAEAETILLDGQRKDPNEISLFTNHAHLAEKQHDRVEAERRWRIVRERFPDSTEGRDKHAATLGVLRALDAADPALVQAETRSLDRQRSDPTDIAAFIGLAQLSEARRDWQAAESRWQIVLRNFPGRPEGYRGVVRSLRKIGRPDDAGPIVTEGLRRFPDSMALMLESARVARDAGRPDTALRILTLVRAHFPRLNTGYVAAANILAETGRYDAARALLTEAMTLLPDDTTVWHAAGVIAEAHGDWGAAVAHWAEMGQHFPHTGYRLHDALLRLAEIDPAAAGAAAQQYVVASPGDALRTLALSFESLGGCGPAGGCEFGLVQRAWGAEPLGLLRWAFIAPDRLIACLRNGFDGIGNPETTEIYMEAFGDDSLWDVRDTRHGFAMHTFVRVNEVPRERMAILTQKRLRYLRDKLIADLKNPTKIFVLNAGDRQLTQAELEDLGYGIRSYGPGELLCVVAADAEHPPGEVEDRAPGVRVAYMDFSSEIDVAPRTPAWLALCRKALGR
jgi:predicted Zn-dependent protease